jgi:hypothetical protein
MAGHRKRTASEIQAEIARLQVELAAIVLGDPSQRVDLGPSLDWQLSEEARRDIEEMERHVVRVG